MMCYYVYVPLRLTFEVKDTVVRRHHQCHRTNTIHQTQRLFGTSCCQGRSREVEGTKTHQHHESVDHVTQALVGEGEYDLSTTILVQSFVDFGFLGSRRCSHGILSTHPYPKPRLCHQEVLEVRIRIWSIRSKAQHDGAGKHGHYGNTGTPFTTQKITCGWISCRYEKTRSGTN